MKYIIVFVALVFQTVYVGAQSKSITSCDKWVITPYLYNDSVSNQSEVCFWQNYWYEKDTSADSYLPDTLVVALNLIPSSELWEMDASNMGPCRIISNLFFKLGESSDSYNIVNLKNTDCILLLDTSIDLSIAFDYINQIEQGFISIATVYLPMREMLSLMNVFTNVFGENVLREDGKSLRLNQVIIETAVYDSDGSLCRRFEFTFPINGCYGRH